MLRCPSAGDTTFVLKFGTPLPVYTELFSWNFITSTVSQTTGLQGGKVWWYMSDKLEKFASGRGLNKVLFRHLPLRTGKNYVNISDGIGCVPTEIGVHSILITRASYPMSTGGNAVGAWSWGTTSIINFSSSLIFYRNPSNAGYFC
jgi:hypothetical protein